MRTRRWLRRNRNAIRIVMAVVGIGLIGGTIEAVRLLRFHMEEVALREEIDRLKRENRELEAMRQGLENDPGVIEKMAREKYGMIRDGDRVYRIVEPEPREEEPDGEGVDSKTGTR
jgi:cell division protein FtsB